jgi:hypothetical protein
MDDGSPDDVIRRVIVGVTPARVDPSARPGSALSRTVTESDRRTRRNISPADPIGRRGPVGPLSLEMCGKRVPARQTPYFRHRAGLGAWRNPRKARGRRASDSSVAFPAPLFTRDPFRVHPYGPQP